MKVKELMTKTVESCPPDADLGTAGRIMWHHDCGVVPVVEGANRKVIGMITDRDIAVGLSTTDRRAHERTVREVMSRMAFGIGPEADANDALDVMAKNRVRRLPVVNADGHLQGIVSLNDLVQFAEEVRPGEKPRVSMPKFVHTVQAICAHPSDEGRTTRKSEVATALK